MWRSGAEERQNIEPARHGVFPSPGMLHTTQNIRRGRSTQFGTLSPDQ